MSSKPISPIRRAWYRWKSLRLPWRKKFLVGLDLNQNLFYEFHDQLSSTPGRMRRIVHFRNRTLLYSEAATQISPAWHQWLRHTRADPPSLAEQSQDVARQEQLKILAAQADARWAAKPSVLDRPGAPRGQPLPALKLRDPGAYPRGVAVGDGRGADGRREEGSGTEKVVGMEGELKGQDAASVSSPASGSQDVEPEIKMQTPDGVRHRFTRGERPPKGLKELKDDPWKKARGTPGEEWQPKAWDPNSLAPKR